MKYQVLDPLRPEELRALKEDIKARGIQIPVDVDEDGNILDGHNRATIAKQLGIDCPKVVRHFATEEEKREHVLKMNLLRRHMTPIQWGRMFKKLCEVRGVRKGSHPQKGQKVGKSPTGTTVRLVADELGVPVQTAKRNLAKARDYEALPEEEQKKVDTGEKTLKEACQDNGVVKPYAMARATRVRDAISGQIKRPASQMRPVDRLKEAYLKASPQTQKSFVAWLRERKEI